MLEAGMKAPEFALPDQNGKVHTLEEYKGKKVILYFYPRDNTPGCTKQACGFGELYPEFSEKGAVVLGVSKDSVASHKKFEEKYGLPFTLLSDTELTCIQAYDVWKEKNMYGKKTMGVVRTRRSGGTGRDFGLDIRQEAVLPQRQKLLWRCFLKKKRLLM